MYVVISMIYDRGIMLEDYKKIKEVYLKSVIMIKAGNFYESLNDDAIIMNNVFGYKIKSFKNYSRVGFPISNLIKVTKELTKREINYITLDDGIIKKEKFSHNKYNDYINKDNDNNNDVEKRLNHVLALKKIKSINKDLMDNIDNPKIIDILNEMEKLICKINL